MFQEEKEQLSTQAQIQNVKSSWHSMISLLEASRKLLYWKSFYFNTGINVSNTTISLYFNRKKLRTQKFQRLPILFIHKTITAPRAKPPQTISDTKKTRSSHSWEKFKAAH